MIQVRIPPPPEKKKTREKDTYVSLARVTWKLVSFLVSCYFFLWQCWPQSHGSNCLIDRRAPWCNNRCSYFVQGKITITTPIEIRNIWSNLWRLSWDVSCVRTQIIVRVLTRRNNNSRIIGRCDISSWRYLGIGKSVSTTVLNRQTEERSRPTYAIYNF